MADKENEGKVSKLKRKFSRKSLGKVPVPEPSPEAASPVGVRSATLPLSYDPRTLALHESQSEGLFSKLRRRFRLGSKGKYDLKSYTENSPSKPRWLRRKSEEAQLQSDENSLSLGVDPKNAVGKSNSVKTQRKAKSDKEEVILIRKDKRVSVICKAENGESEVIFSNVDNPDEDLSETLSEVEEDPYATIRSVKDEIAKKNKNKTVAGRQKIVEVPCGAVANNINDTEKSVKIAVDMDEYPYAKIDPNRKKLLTVSQPSLEAVNLSKQTDGRVRSQFEPDYETLDDIKQKKNEFRSQGNILASTFEVVLAGSNLSCSVDPPGGLDPDYESLDEVKQKCASSNLSSHMVSVSAKNTLSCMNGAYQPVLDKTVVEISGACSPCSNSHGNSEASSIRQSPLLGASADCKRHPRTSVANSQGSRPVSMPSPHLGGRTSSSSSPSALAPLAPSIDSSLPHDTPLNLQASPQEECLYDNPNIMLRKQVSRSMTNTSSLTRRGHTHSEPPVIKTPAEEELVEKLSALLAPPLPLRNYQKDEIKSRSGTGSARHSWSSQSSRNIESGEFNQAKDIEKSPLASLNHSRENLIMKSVKDSLVGQVYERHDFFSRSNGADLLRKKELGGLDKYLRKSSPQAVKSNKLLDKNKDVNKSDSSAVNKIKGKLGTCISPSETFVEKINNEQRKEAFITLQGQHSHEPDVVSFCQELAKSVLEEAFKQCGNSGTSCTHHLPENAIITDMKTLEDSSSVPISSEADKEVSTTGNSQITDSITGTEFNNSQSHRSAERCAKFVSTHVSDPSRHLESTCRNLPSTSLFNSTTAVSDTSKHNGEKAMGKEDGRNGNSFRSNAERKTIRTDNAAENVLYNMQGARPKVKPLLLEPTTRSSPEPYGYAKHPETLLKCCNGGEEEKFEGEKTVYKQLPQHSDTFNEALFPACSLTSMYFHDNIKENISQEQKSSKHGKSEWLKKSEEEYNKYFENADSSVQETIYVDSDEELGLVFNKHITVHVKRNQCISKVAKPIVYANPRLLENVISGAFKREISLDTAYLAHGIFRWGRYFPALEGNRQAVENKLKAFLNFVLEMLLSHSRLRRNQSRVRKLQEVVDWMQLKIEKRLQAVQDLPTFQNIRHHLLKTDTIDDWEPEKPVESYFYQPEGHRDLGRISNKEVSANNHHGLSRDLSEDGSVIRNKLSPVHTDKKVVSIQDSEVGEILHSEDSFSELDEVFTVFDNRQTVLNLPTSSREALDEFLQLSKCRLNCRYCSADEESDSEDEMVTVETYAKTVSTSPCPQFSKHIDYICAGSLCRAFHGELAYMAYMRKHRAPRKMLNVPGPDNECGGSESHLSWNSWCSIDALLKKLVPHISPRLDFQYLLRTYAEFKHFVLIDRKRNLEHKGCFVKRFPNHVQKCCRFEEFVFLKIIRDEIKHFSNVFCVSEASRDLFLEERDVGFSLLSLLRLVLQNIHKMRKSMTKEEVGLTGSEDDLHVIEPEDSSFSRIDLNHRVNFRHSAFQTWPEQEDYFVDPLVSTDQQEFHIRNFENFRFGGLSMTLRNWKPPQAYVHDPNVLASCRSVFAKSNTKALELTGIKDVEEPKPLQEQQDFLESMEQLQLKDWYWGPISYEQATLILKDKEDGSFLVRDSSDQKYLLSLSFKSLGEVHHTRIEHAKGLFSFWSQPESHGKARICEFIEKSIQNSRDGRFLYFLRPSARGTPPLPIRLLTPVSRNFRVATLKHLSRFVVRQSVRKDHLDLLPVPEKVKRYLRDKQYYVEILDDDQWAFDGDYGKSSK